MGRKLLITLGTAMIAAGALSDALAGPQMVPARAEAPMVQKPPRMMPPPPPPGQGPHGTRPLVTPYGDFCVKCSKYGTGGSQVERGHAEDAVRSYFTNRGYRIENVRGIGRFLKVDVYKDNDLVDRVIFDRRSGRLRSMY